MTVIDEAVEKVEAASVRSQTRALEEWRAEEREAYTRGSLTYLFPFAALPEHWLKAPSFDTADLFYQMELCRAITYALRQREAKEYEQIGHWSRMQDGRTMRVKLGAAIEAEDAILDRLIAVGRETVEAA